MGIIRKKAALLEYAGAGHPILWNSPEILFMQAVCAGRTEEALSYFREEKLFGGCPVLDAPQGRYEGLSAIRSFAEGWLELFEAASGELIPVIQTRANGRSVTEAVVNFRAGGVIDQVPMFLVGDLRTAETLDELRIYFHFTHVKGLTGYRRPLFTSAHLEMGDPQLLTGAVREYYEALHHTPCVQVDRILKTMQDGCRFGGYEPVGTESHGTSREELRNIYEHMAAYIPKWVGMRYETIIDDGKNCVIEWVHIVSREGREKAGRVCISGISSYERGEDGLLCSIRICDYAGFEKSIDWTKTPLSKEEAYAVNFVEEFPSGCGRKPQG
ncbi:MAG: hypothetical protein HFJ85_04720 [Oscillospiraceae bacterium]|nr:hypothetical protein [Oscillospiraceae bacterium]